MDARAYRMVLPELRVFEVDQKTTFDVKEPLLKEDALSVASRAVVPTEFTERGRWGADLIAAGFDKSVPTVWLLEGLLMYLSLPDTHELMTEMGRLSAPGSAVFHDACSQQYVGAGVVVGGAKFIGGSDDYGRLWAEHAGFDRSHVHDFSNSFRVDRANRRVESRQWPEATAKVLRGKQTVLFVEASKSQPTCSN
jgi:methyltransferase (TIGR00027 family)